MKEINPFVIGKYVSDKYFCDREEETSAIQKHLLNGRNVTLISDRRIGKSGLISHVFAQPSMQKQFYTINVDLYSTNSLSELVCMLSNEVYRSLYQHTASWRDTFFRIISSLRVGFKLDPLTGAPSFDVGVGDITTPEMTLEQIFDYLEKANKPCVVAFDEFQQITNYAEKNVEALLRTYIQRCKQTQFIFAGSRKHLMAQMFLSPSKPFYQSTINMGLDVIEKETYISFAQRMFAFGKKTIDSDLVSFVYDACRGITWYMQVLLSEMYNLTDKETQCPKEAYQQALQNIVLVQEPFYHEIITSLPARQKALLFALADAGKAENITSIQFVQKHKLQSPSSVQAALKGLNEKDMVTKIGDSWMVYDVFFQHFIRIEILHRPMILPMETK